MGNNESSSSKRKKKSQNNRGGNLNTQTPRQKNVNKTGSRRSDREEETRGGNRFSIESQVQDNYNKKKVGLDDFVLMKTVGKGSFGKVIQVKLKETQKVYAMKVLKKEQVIRRKQFEHTMAERRILEEINHPFIVSLRFAFQTTQKLYMVFDFFNGGELFHYLSKIGRFHEERARLYAAEIALGLEHIHQMNIIYRDLKPENLLLDATGHIRITDFGLSKENVTGDDVKSFCGTPEYLAPEVLKRQKYGKSVDWWSLGTLLFEMISGLPPFYDRNRERMYKKILGADLRFPSFMNPEARSICRGMLNRNSKERLGYAGAHEIKSHPFFNSLNFDEVLTMDIDPPFRPVVHDEEDTRNVDAQFTEMPAAVTPTPDNIMRSAINQEKEFENFTFTAPKELGGGTFAVSYGDPEAEFDEIAGMSEFSSPNAME